MNLRELQVVFLKRLGANQGIKVIDLSAGHENLGKVCLCTLFPLESSPINLNSTLKCMFIHALHYEQSFYC